MDEPQIAYDFETASHQIKAKPFIKWAGGKWQLMPVLRPHFPSFQKVANYFEPFLGGGALFFYTQHPRSVLTDGNRELIELYTVVRDDVENLINALKKHKNNEEYYYNLRARLSSDLDPIQKASRFIYLNKTCYNGLYRVNSKMQFNVPFGNYKNPLICDVEGLRAASYALKHALLVAADFEQATSFASFHDFVYFDPPYQPISKTSSFTSYTAQKFDDREQIRLATLFRDLDHKGVFVLLSNSNTPLMRELYSGYDIIEIQANRAINCKAGGRGKITELLIKNY